LFFPLALPFKVCECDVFMAVLPVHTIAPCFHLVYEVLSACGCFSAVHDRKGCILHITFHFSLFGLLQEVVCFFIPRNSFFSFFSGECLSLFRNMKPLLPALLIAPVFQVLQIRFAPLQLVTILIIHAVHYKMAVNVSSVYMSGNKHFMPFPCFCVLGKLHSVLMGLLWCDMLVLVVALNEVLISSATSLAPQLLGGLHFVLNCIWFTVQTADKFIFRLFLFRHIVQCLPYACF
jgi:hypothetical protein